MRGFGCGAELSGQGLAGQAFVNAHYARHVQVSPGVWLVCFLGGFAAGRCLM